jgi:hypothetical protein
MKGLLAGTFLLLASFCFASVSMDEIIKLSELKTSDDVILQLIQKEGLDKPVTSNDVVYLKQHGVSDRVVKYMMKLNGKEATVQLPPQEGEATQLSENMRSYYTTGKNGKKIRVVTNLDKTGKRMGGEVLPEPEPAPREQQKAPQEVRVIVENEPRQYDDYARPEPQYPEEEYVDDKYLPPSAFPPDYLQYYPSYAPYYYPYQNYRPHRNQFDPNQANWRYDQHLDRQRPQQQLDRQRPQQSQRPGRVSPGPGGAGGVRPPRGVRSK